tara:strand:- start:350 stop:700 length:351 start_codon:yes stop_codon:yes gene_type:complete
MKIAIQNASQFRDRFEHCGRGNQFSYEALELLFDYLEDINTDYELDVIAICCEYSEDSVSNIARNYGIDLSDGVCTASAYGLEQVAKAEAAAVLAYLNDHTSVVGVTPSGIVYALF